MHNPTSFDKLWPISLCSGVYNIFSKIVTTCLSRGIYKVVSQEQGGFVPSRNIFENIMLAQDMVHSLNRKIVGGNMIAKIDMSKAYDRVHWDFLQEVLHTLASLSSSMI